MSRIYSDKEIIALILGADTSDFGFRILVKNYQERIYWHIRRMVFEHDDANDIAQNTFVKVWQNIHSFRSDSNLYTWIYRIATNETLDFIRKKKRYVFSPDGDYKDLLLKNLEDDNIFDGNEIEKKFQKALLTLPEKQRIVFNMKYFDEMKYEEISEILNTSVGALKASYHHAVKKIKINLTDD
ncbi:MAG: sigma-70 family RNA polymerase sigma factor [Bacteroidales bacterium]|nr:sigma-70 family RNA polymerase sigma factor [Bacteroidales bacterium]